MYCFCLFNDILQAKIAGIEETQYPTIGTCVLITWGLRLSRYNDLILKQDLSIST